ncbi:MAG TPA: FHA domain-containing protein [Ktedonobacterales bacterium]
MNNLLQQALQLNNFLLLLRIGLVALLYLVVLQVVGVARRDLRRLAVAPAGAASGRPIVGHLVVVDSGSTPLLPGSRLDLEAVTTLGRSPTNNVPLESTYISTEHTRVIYRDRSLWVEDLGSKNGTYVNGRRISGAMAVRPNDILQVGDVKFKITV